MLEFSRYQLNNVVTYKHADFCINADPLTKITGLNKDSRSGRDTNAVGKSVLFNTLGSVLLNFIPTNTKKREKNTLLASKDSWAKINIKRNNTEYLVTQYFEGGSRWEIERNGQKKSFRKTEDALQYIRQKIITMSDQQWASQVVVDGRTKTILQSGSSKQRFEYFEDVFKLGVYDTLSASVNKEYNRIKALHQERQILLSEYWQKKKSLPEGDHATLTKHHEIVKRKCEAVSHRTEKLLNRLNNIKTYLAVSDSSNKNLNDLQEELDEAQVEDKQATAAFKRAVVYHEQKKLFLSVNERKLDLLKQLKALPPLQYSEDHALDLYETTQNELQDLNETIDAETQRRESSKVLKEELNNLRNGNEELFLKYQKASASRINAVIAQNKAQIKILDESIQSLEHFVGGHHEKNCPTCQRPLNQNSAQILIDQSLKQKKRYSLRVVKLQKLLAYNSKNEALTLLAPQHNLKKLKQKSLELENKLEELKFAIKNAQKRNNLRKQIKNLPNVDFDPSLNLPRPLVYDELREGIQNRIHATQKEINNLKKLKELGLENQFTTRKAAAEEKENTEALLSELRPLFNILQGKQSTLSNNLSVFEHQQKDLNRLKKRLAELKGETKDLQIWESLRKAFGAKGLRKVKTVFFASKLQKNLNKYASFIFGEPIQFQINVSSTNLDILAERNGKIADVRSLSGAESTAFTLLLLVCMLPFVPSSNRCNFVVLDEIESGRSAAAKQLFVDKFLPLLQQIVPHVFLITPQAENEFYVPNAQSLCVVKQNKVAVLQRNHP